LDDLAIERGYWFDQRFAGHFRQFCRRFLCLWEGRQWAGKPFELLDWQWYDVFAPLFGWYRWDDEWSCPVRRFDRAYVEVPKKNGKSPMAAAVGCYFLAGDGETGGKVFSAASAREQAGIVHGHAMAMIRSSPWLDERCKINRSTQTIVFEPPEMFEKAKAKIDRAPSQNVYKAISSEAGPQEGRNANAVVCDELHVWYGRKLWEALQYAFETRLSPLRFAITTAGDDEQSVCYEQHEYARDVRRGHVQDLGFFGYVRAADPEDDSGDERTWFKANPSLGKIITVGRMREMYDEAQKSASGLRSFERYRLNRWGTVANPLLRPEDWDACQNEYTAADLREKTCYGGLDLSKSEDPSALALIFPDGDGYRQLVWFWLPQETYERNRERVRYEDWVREGWLEICPGPRIDEELIEQRIVWAKEEFSLQSVHYDPYRAHAIVKRLDETHGIECIEFPQTITRFAGPTAEYESLIVRRKLRHNRNGCLTWQSRHLKTKADANKNERPVKPARGDIRTIDGHVASIMALALIETEDVGESIYEQRGLLTI